MFKLIRDETPDPAYYQKELNDFGKNTTNVFLGDGKSDRSMSATKLKKKKNERLQFTIQEIPGPGTYMTTSTKDIQPHVVTPKIVEPDAWIPPMLLHVSKPCLKENLEFQKKHHYMTNTHSSAVKN